MNVTILGRPFHRLTSELELMNWHLTYVLDVNINTVVENSHALSKSDVVIVVSLNILLNHYNLDIFSAIIKNSSPKTKIFLWTQEPFWDATSLNQDFALIFGRKVYFYNVVNGKSFLSIYSHYFGVGGVLWSEKRITNLEVPERDFLKKRFELGQANGHLVSAYATCFHDVRLDLKYSIVRERNDLIYHMYKYGICEVYGKNWTKSWALDVSDESRDGLLIDGKKISWGSVKVNNVRNRHSFSICLENCLLKNYVTEKFPQALESWSIPIYFSGNGLEDEMDVSPAIILEKGFDKQSVLKTVESMSFNEYFERLNILINSYNKVISNVQYVNHERELPAKKIINEIKNNY